MRSSRLLFAVLFALSAGVVSLAPRRAAAVPCCSAPICQRVNPPSICAICSNCAGESDDGIDYEHDFDDAAGLCYLVGAE